MYTGVNLACGILKYLQKCGEFWVKKTSILWLNNQNRQKNLTENLKFLAPEGCTAKYLIRFSELGTFMV